MFILNKNYRDTKKTIDSISPRHAGNARKKAAIFVMVQNEPTFLPIWLKYYSRYFSGDDIYIFNHRTTDGSIEEYAKQFSFNIIDLDYPYSFDHKWFQFVIKKAQRQLLKFYEYVVFTDIDEIILPTDPAYNGLDDYIHKLKTDYVRCKGYDLIHMKEKEAVFDTAKGVLTQRNYWYPTHWYDKTLISRVPLHWWVGNHEVTKIKSNRDNSLLLIHLHKLDFDMCWNKNLEKAKLNWNEVDIKKNKGFQNRINQMDEFKKYYYHWPFEDLPIEKIPEKIKSNRLF